MESTSLFLKTYWLKASNFIKKKDPNKGAFMQNLQNFQEHLFLQDTSGGCFCIFLKEYLNSCFATLL